MEKVGLDWFEGVYAGKRILVTGHTGFKGSWLTVWLQLMGAEVYGLSLKADGPQNHWELLNLDVCHMYADIRDPEAVTGFIEKIQPHFVFHLAAQSLVLDSYADPLKTWSTNVLGTATLLEACRNVEELQGIIVVTTDKCYENKGWVWGYRETDTLGGLDPYSASKACTELVVSSFKQSFFKVKNAPLIATARAGNVIGGGDWAKDRIIVDCVTSWSEGNSVNIRSPGATRPWQHVLEPLSGYLSLGQSLVFQPKLHGNAFNFGPKAEQNHTVVELLEDLCKQWGFESSSDAYQVIENIPFHEAGLLKLNCDKALFYLKWDSNLEYSETIKLVGDWYYSYYQNQTDMYKLTLNQIEEYEKLALNRNKYWTK